MAQDEGCFGRISRPQRCWAPPGVRPHAPAQLVREYVYVYAAVAPAQGQMTSLILPEGSTTMMREEERHHGGRNLRQNQRGHLSLCGSNSGVDIDVFSYQLRRGMWAYTRRSPASLGTADAAKTAFILSHDQDRALIGSFPRCDCRLSLRCKVFLNCSFASGSALGCLGRGISLRQP